MKNVKCRSADLSGAILTEANLGGANCVLSSFSGAFLIDANLEHTKLTEATLSNAILQGARIHGVDLGHVQGLTQEQLNSALGDERTVLPNDLLHPARWTGDEGAREPAPEEGKL